MLSDCQVDRVKSLLGRMSERAVARQSGVSRGSVKKIREGRWQRKKIAGPDGEMEELPPAERCGQCGRKVVMPCRACETEQLPPAPRAPDAIAERIPLELRGKDGERYQVVSAEAFAANHPPEQEAKMATDYNSPFETAQPAFAVLDPDELPEELRRELMADDDE